MSNNNQGPLEPSRVAPDVHPANDGIIEDAQQGDTFPGGGSAVTEQAGKVPFKDQVKGFAKVFAGETFNNPAEVEYGKQRLEGKEPDARLLDSEYADEFKQKVEKEKAGEPKVPFTQQVKGWANIIAGEVEHNPAKVQYGEAKLEAKQPEVGVLNARAEAAREAEARGEKPNVGFVEEAKGYAKKIAGETFDDDAEVAYGEAKIRGEA
ncbi:uncharacterized protein LOC62_05G007013 [Vanrija pseudolonga]|uniref:Uncharacterized protein n=1 Tax=Vanrija pseudolonga TaxID=143232 RepID=A0AAF0YCL7_9TREE|nr:hypothetical protein LOC62_05G007013 [Vanrija pseudolonga]